LSPLAVSTTLFALWAVSWAVAALWSRRTTARPPLADQVAYNVPLFIGAMLMVATARAATAAHPRALAFAAPIWRLPTWAGWVMTVCVAGGVAFMWWARLTLGDLWSGHVTRKEGHQLIERGPYGLVRHPIYTGLIAAFFALAVQFGSPVALIGAVFVTLGFWLKARLEERFLIAGLGEAAYADYRSRTPMLAPFWPTPGRRRHSAAPPPGS
jgi:protein-S-isoprenylcysteine O-methyltransferase Ste14